MSIVRRHFVGATNRRNPTLTEHAVHILPYRGLGTGIPRALHDWPAIELIDDVAANQFRVVIQRPPADAVVPEVTTEVTTEVTGEVRRLLAVIHGGVKRADIQTALRLKHQDHLRDAYLRPALDGGFIEVTVPAKPTSHLQKYRITDAGRRLLQAAETKGPPR